MAPPCSVVWVCSVTPTIHFAAADMDATFSVSVTAESSTFHETTTSDQDAKNKNRHANYSHYNYGQHFFSGRVASSEFQDIPSQSVDVNLPPQQSKRQEKKEAHRQSS